MDPGNRMAQLAHWNELFRRSDGAEDLLRYEGLLRAFSGIANETQQDGRVARLVRWLTERLGRDADPLRLRALYSLTATVVNLEAIPATPQSDPDVLHDDLAAELDRCKSSRQARVLAQRMEGSIETLGWSAKPPQQPPTADESGWNSVAYYNAACYWGSPTDATPTSPRKAARAVEYLIRAGKEPSLSNWRGSDPQLAVLRNDDVYKDAFGESPVGDILSVAPFETYASKLKAAGLTTAAAIASASKPDLAAAGVPWGLTDRVKALALSVKTLPTTDLEARLATWSRCWSIWGTAHGR